MWMRQLFLLVLVAALAACTPARSGGRGDDDDTTDDDDDDDAAAPGSAGCGLTPVHPSGGVQVTIDAGPDGGGECGYWLSLPSNYDPDVSHSLTVGYAGTNWYGEWIQPYLALEDGQRDDEIFVYPDPLWWNFPGWGELGGWLLGPHAYPANGNHDLVLTEAILDDLESTLCIDEDRVFATGHSWGGDMTAVAACFLGDRFTAAAPVAANRPYWFEPDSGGFEGCTGDPSVWTWFGVAADHFTSQAYGGEYGDEQAAFWVEERGCDGLGSTVDLGLDSASTCVEYTGCSSSTRYCLYGSASGHQVPSYYSATTIDWFRSF